MTFYTVLKITNITNGKFYISKHSTDNLNDGYLGSGRLIKQAIRKYGKEQFQKEILAIFESENEAFEYERVLVNEVIGNKMCYNLVGGGRGFDISSAKQASDASRKNGWYGFVSMSDFMEITKRAGKIGAATNKKHGTGMFGWTYEQRKKFSKTNNSDRMWITNGEIELRIKMNDTIPEEFYSGRIIEGSTYRKGMACWTNGKNNVFSEVSPGPDFVLGMKKETPTAKMLWWTDGTTVTRAFEQPGPQFIRGRHINGTKK